MSLLKIKMHFVIVAFLVVVFPILFFPNSLKAATFCISNETELQGALDAAEINGQNDVIQIQQGTYIGNFIYASTEAFGVTIEGGYTNNCTSRVVNHVNTIFDGNNNGRVLVLSSPTQIADFKVMGLKLQNGNGGLVFWRRYIY